MHIRVGCWFLMVFIFFLVHIGYAVSKNNIERPLDPKQQQELEQILKEVETKISEDDKVQKEAEILLKRSLNSSIGVKAIQEAYVAAQAKLDKEGFKDLTLKSFNSTGGIKSEHLNLTKKTYYLFVSSSIPIITLKNYAISANKLKGQKDIKIQFFTQGFVNGVREIGPTVNWYFSFAYPNLDFLYSKKEPPLVSLEVNPKLAEDLELKMVPALIDVDRKCVVYGDASLDVLLEKLEKGRCNGIFGQTYEIAEINALKEIQIKIANFDWSNYQKKIKKKIKKSLEDQLHNFYCMDLPLAKVTQTYTIEPSYTLDFDIPDPRYNDGTILYPAGFSFNPLQYVSLPGSILIINGNRQKEVEKENLLSLIEKLPRPVRIFPTQGDITKIHSMIHNNELFDVYVYPSCTALKKLIKQYGLCKYGTPCAISTENTKFVVTEYKLD